jgi:hypothetical protein
MVTKKILIEVMAHAYVVEVDDDNNILPSSRIHLLELDTNQKLYGPGEEVEWAQDEWPYSGEGTIIEVSPKEHPDRTHVACRRHGSCYVTTTELFLGNYPDSLDSSSGWIAGLELYK